MDKDKREAGKMEYINKLVEYLPTLRASSKITQNQLAKKLGIARSTMVVIESKNRNLQWSMCLALILIFLQYEDSKKLLISFELFDSTFLREII